MWPIDGVCVSQHCSTDLHSKCRFFFRLGIFVLKTKSFISLVPDIGSLILLKITENILSRNHGKSVEGVTICAAAPDRDNGDN